MKADYARAETAFAAEQGTKPVDADRLVKGKDRAPAGLIDRLVDRLKARVEDVRAAQAADVARQQKIVGAMVLVAFVVLSVMLVRVNTGISVSVRALADDVGSNAHEVLSASEQVSSAAQELARGVQSQAAAVEETAAAMEEIAATARQNLQHASRCAELMTSTSQGVEVTNQRLTEMLGSMDRIRESARKVSHIVKTIDDIAFQTNLLALNAAVEAARAARGRHGIRRRRRRSQDAGPAVR